MFAARPSYCHSEEVFEEEMDGLLHSDSLSSPVFSPTPLMQLQQLQHSPPVAGGGRYRRESAGSKQHLVYLPPPTRSPPPSSSSSLSSSSSSPPHNHSGAVRQRRASRTYGPCSSSSKYGPMPAAASRRPELLRLRTTTNEGAEAGSYTQSTTTAGKQLLSLSPSYHSVGRRPSWSSHALREKEKETLTLRPPVKPINNVCLYCYQGVCALYSIHGQAPPRIEDCGEWTGHVMKRGEHIECHRLRELYRSQQKAYL